ncbi:hypothetical protein GCM10029964_011230 [Kibdelosporangium lantanae]
MTNRLVGGRYRLDRPVGSGGMGEVWEALDVRLDRRVAVKLLRPDGFAAGVDQDVLVNRFGREARMTARLHHPGVPAVHDTGADGDDLYLVLELVEGADLTEFQAENEPVPLTWVAAVGAQIASVLGAAHAANLVHRDLKPRNVMVTGTGRVKVLDFGIAVLRDTDVTRITRTSESVGTPAYMAPEQAMHGLASHSSDLYSLGCVLYELVTGEPVFHATTALALMHRHFNDRPRPLTELRPDVPPELAALITDLLAKQPQDRPATARDVYDRLLPLVQPVDQDLLMDPTRPFRDPLSTPPRPQAAVTSPTVVTRTQSFQPVEPRQPPAPQPVAATGLARRVFESALLVIGCALPVRYLVTYPTQLLRPETVLALAIAFAIAYPGAVMRQRRLNLPTVWSPANSLRWTRPPRHAVRGELAVEVILLSLSGLFAYGALASLWTPGALPLVPLVESVAVLVPGALMRQRRLGRPYPWT